MKSTLEKRILIFAFLTITLTITVNTFLNIESFRRDYRDGILLRSKSLAEGLKMSMEDVLALGLELRDLSGISERCKTIVATDPEIAYCLVEDMLGEPLFASDFSFRFSPTVALVKALNRDTALIEYPSKVRFYDVSVSVFGVNGTLSGRIHIGFPESVLFERIVNVLQRSLVVLAGAFLVVFLVIFLFSKRDLIGPISQLRSVARKISSGNFMIDIPPMSTSDFSELGSALKDMASSLRERDLQIRQGYKDLEETNRQLQDSYENLERIGSELGRSREMYRSLLEDASDAILVSDEEDCIVLLNKVAESFFGVTRAKSSGHNLFSFLERLQCENLDHIYDMHRRVLKGESIETEFRFTRQQERLPSVGWLKASPVVGRDGRRRVQSIIRDVTREHEIKQNLENSTQDLQRLNQMKDSFLGVASHELKTPLTVIIGYSELLLGELHERLDSSVHAMVEHIANAAERLSVIVRDMVDVTMLEYHRLQLRKQVLDINQLIEGAASELELFFIQRKQVLETDFQNGLPRLSCDPDRIGQVISNLVGNAIKFTPDGGRIKIATRLISSLRTPGGPSPENQGRGFVPISRQKHHYVEINISDSGIGIDPKDQPYIFDKFYEVGNIEEHFTAKIAFKGKGTGLGLTIVKGIVDMHGGEVWVESTGNDPKAPAGSQFLVMLPVDFSADTGLA
jgi:PAS domain S-box-containing protein